MMSDSTLHTPRIVDFTSRIPLPNNTTATLETQPSHPVNTKTSCGMGHAAAPSIPVTTIPGTIPGVILYHAHTLLLFTCDQILDTVIPGTTFGITAATSGPVLDLPAQNITSILQRILLVAVWLWLVILQFCLQNQRNPGSVEEDSINKPWRPIPSGRVTSAQVEYLLIATHILASVASCCLGVLPIFVVYIILITAYNDFGGGDHNGILRNLFCGAGFSCYFSGAMSIALGPDISMSFQAWKWTLLITFCILATTIQTQDFRDEAGDKARNRSTLVTKLGRKPALWTVIILVPLWSLYTTLVFFEGGWKMAVIPVVLGGTLVTTAFQAMGGDMHELDRRMYKIWCLWMFGLCPLPVMKIIWS